MAKSGHGSLIPFPYITKDYYYKFYPITPTAHSTGLLWRPTKTSPTAEHIWLTFSEVEIRMGGAEIKFLSKRKLFQYMYKSISIG